MKSALQSTNAALPQNIRYNGKMVSQYRLRCAGGKNTTGMGPVAGIS